MKNISKSYDDSKLIKEKVLYLNNKKDTNKSLILWGTNLHSTVGEKLTRNELNIVKLPYFTKSVIVGILLSDGYIIFSTRSKNGRLGLTQSLFNSAYLYFVFNILAHYCPRYPIFKERFRFGKPLLSLEIVTRSMSCITELYSNFYVNKIKVIKHCFVQILIQ